MIRRRALIGSSNIVFPCLTFTSSSGTVSITPSRCWNATTKEYSTDGGTTWNTWSSGAIVGNTVKVRGLGGTTASATSTSNYSAWSITGTNVACSGNIESILDYSVVANGEHPIMNNYCCYYMFSNCNELITAPELPAITLSNYCYSYMFNNCTSLTIPPVLPATTLSERCYQGMFYNCTALITTPLFTAMTLATYCYNAMFFGCTSLITAHELPATTLSGYCYGKMFNGCTALAIAPEIKATTMANYCCNQMFYGCTALITAPVLYATNLTQYCCSSMFYGCTSLITPPSLYATKVAPYCCSSMFYGCTSLTTVPVLRSTSLAISCYSSMFNGCTALYVSDTSGTGYDNAWRIPSTGTFTNAYSQTNMFANCLGTRSSNNMSGAKGKSYTYYTQNTPV